ncbi:MAG: hypothetical protein K0S61_143 [Anaerocolumna sp.]|jgi:hypothetical protein|nr:hypothetical protein [Anaerocolumna sp.]
MSTSKKEESPKRRRPPALTPEARENQLITLAVDLAEKQLSEGTASSQVLAHYLKLASTRERKEIEKLEQENKLLKAKTEAIASQKRVEELYKNALNAMKSYSGKGDSNDED